MTSLEKDVPTVVPEAHFDPGSDSATLRKAMKGLGTDEDKIIEILSRRTSAQRQKILHEYTITQSRDLLKDLRSELNGTFEDSIIALMTPLPLFLARELHSAVSGLGTKEKTLCEILCTQTNSTIMDIKRAYEQEYSKSMVDAISKDTSGQFQDLMVALCGATRDEANKDLSIAAGLAQKLFEAGEKKFGTDESEFQRVMVSYSYPILRQVFVEYEKLAGKTLEQSIKDEVSGDFKLGLLTIYQSIDHRAKFLASLLHGALKGLGTKERTLIRIIVTRSEIDLATIKKVYLADYNKSLEDAVKSDTSGDFKKILLALLLE